MSRIYSVVFVVGGLSRGGIEKHLIEVVREMVDRSIDVSVIVLFDHGPLLEPLIDTGVSVIHPDNPISGKIHLTRLLTVDYLRHLVRCWRILRRPGTILHAFMATNLISGWLLAKVANVEIVIASRVSRNFYKNARPLIHRIETLINRRIYAVLGNSRKVVDDLASEQCPTHKIKLVYTGIDAQGFGIRRKDEIRGNLEIRQDQFVLCKVANLISYKGHFDLLNALGRIKNRLPKDWLLLLVGRDDGLRSRLNALAQKLEIDRNVQFLGSRDDVSSILCAADVGILTSHTEGFATAILEYMATGLPVVATDVGGNREALGDFAGVVVKPHDVEGISRAIVSISQDEYLREEMGRAGSERVRTRFSVKQTVSQYVAIYETALSQAST